MKSGIREEEGLSSILIGSNWTSVDSTYNTGLINEQTLLNENMNSST